ncbi:helix-turn-helix domain-containing protein [Candidatus Gottesmanbacteria bacterium]|nr:helix-turn-helix domain-containing protein [Candidatus Gottesmanbacteria bacterium]
MHTIGEILKRARLEKKLTFEEIEIHLRIRKKFLVALEENSWEKLPSLPYIKGFLKNYSSFLGLKPDEMLAIFRRQFRQQERQGLLPEGVTEPLNQSFFRYTPKTISILVIVFFILFFLGYLFYQYRNITSPPPLEITSPKEGQIFSSDRISVTGITNTDAVILVNNQKIAVDESGHFFTTITFAPGTNIVVVESVSKYNRKNTVKRTIQIQGD